MATANKTRATKLSVAAFLNGIDEVMLTQLIGSSMKYMRKNYETR